MSDALTPLRHVYGLEPDGGSAPGAPGHAEQEALRGMARALDAAFAAAPTAPPSAAAVDAVLASAAAASAERAAASAAVRSAYDEGPEAGGAVEAAVLRQSREALDRAVAARPRPRPDAAAVDAVLARAAEASFQAAVPAQVAADRPALAPLAVALGGAGASSAESALLAQSLDALDRTPRHRPSAAAVDAVLAAAAASSSAGLDAVRSVYEGGAAPDAPVELALLSQSREVIDRALRARPQPRPSEAAVAAVLARAAEASAERADEPTVSDPALAPLALAYGLPLAVEAPAGGAELALLDGTQAALDRLRPARPDAAAIEAVLARAASATRRPAPRADRPAARPERRRLPSRVWAGGAALVLSALTAVAVFSGVLSSGEQTLAPAASAVVAASGGAASGPELAAVGVEEEAEPPTAPPSAPAVAAPQLAAVAAPQAAPPRPAPAAARRAPAARPAAETPPWEASEDVRALSLRLEELDRSSDGLAWDEPAEAFGRPGGSPGLTSMPGLQSVRAGAPPARARIAPTDSSRTPR
ncbi:hypothetical protein RQM47_00325 [Rubrivirga sp. S365]|uniref:hypothetical protein n=1 Tax=Rubrivirga sp. S365 TaxID=3076080 RepID=UPI0028CB0A07|nr:hypothetical protein [Rubrivirga sp. S365]MDT7855080.1 hypothetical protein [Rubrivirga sp. S365]